MIVCWQSGKDCASFFQKYKKDRAKKIKINVHRSSKTRKK